MTQEVSSLALQAARHPNSGAPLNRICSKFLFPSAVCLYHSVPQLVCQFGLATSPWEAPRRCLAQCLFIGWKGLCLVTFCYSLANCLSVLALLDFPRIRALSPKSTLVSVGLRISCYPPHTQPPAQCLQLCSAQCAPSSEFLFIKVI